MNKQQSNTFKICCIYALTSSRSMIESPTFSHISIKKRQYQSASTSLHFIRKYCILYIHLCGSYFAGKDLHRFTIIHITQYTHSNTMHCYSLNHQTVCNAGKISSSWTDTK